MSGDADRIPGRVGGNEGTDQHGKKAVGGMTWGICIKEQSVWEEGTTHNKHSLHHLSCLALGNMDQTGGGRNRESYVPSISVPISRMSS